MTAPPPLAGPHLLSLPASDLAVSLAFYERALGARRIPELDHREGGRTDALVLSVPDLGIRIGLRLDPARADQHRGFTPITLAVTDREALQAWHGHLDVVGVPHSPVLTGERDWLVIMSDPDDNRLCLVTREVHGPQLRPTRDRWLLGW